MKTLSIFLISAIFVLSMFSFVLAEENTDSFNVSGDLIRDTTSISVNVTESGLDLNESVSDGKIFWKEVGLWFTFNQEKKARLELDLARLRLIQARNAAKNGDEKAMQNALEAHDKILNRVRGRVEKINFSNSQNLSIPAEQLRGLEEAIFVHERRIALLNQTLINANLTEQERVVLERRLEHTQNVTDDLVRLNEDHREKLVTRVMARQNLSQEDAENLLELRKQNREEALTQARQEIRNQIEENRGEIQNLRRENRPPRAPPINNLSEDSNSSD